MQPQITVQAFVKSPVEKVWKFWTEPEHITKWNQASADWYSPHATNDLRVGGKFNTRMESRDGKHGFDFEGTYTTVETFKKIEYSMGDGRKVSVHFSAENGGVTVTELFDPESINPIDLQRDGWQTILNNFKNYTELTQ